MTDERECREAFERFFASAIEQSNTAADAQNEEEKRLCWHVWDAAWSSRPAPDVEGLVRALETLIPYVEWQITEGPGHHPTMPSALAQARAALTAYKDGK